MFRNDIDPKMTYWQTTLMVGLKNKARYTTRHKSLTLGKGKKSGDGPTDGPNNGQTYPLMETLGRDLKWCKKFGTRNGRIPGIALRDKWKH